MSRFINSLSTAYMIGKAVWNVYQTQRVPADSPLKSPAAYRPPRWSQFDKGGVYIQEQQFSAIYETKDLFDKSTPYGYYFDAFLRESHEGSVRITDHPVQSGANISDHAYNMPDSLTVEILVSDVMDVLYPGQFSGEATKSISAYEKLRELKEKRQPLAVATRLRMYYNMIIESTHVNDDYKTAQSLRCTVNFREILMASAYIEKMSVKTSTKEEKRVGPKTPNPVDNRTVLQKASDLLGGM